MNTFRLKVSSPEGDLFCGEAVRLIIRGTEGDLAVLTGHIPFVSYIKPCDCKIELESGEEMRGRIESGVLSVSENMVRILTGNFMWL